MNCDRCKEEPIDLLIYCENCGQNLCEGCYGDPTSVWCISCEEDLRVGKHSRHVEEKRFYV